MTWIRPNASTGPSATSIASTSEATRNVPSRHPRTLALPHVATSSGVISECR